MMGSLQRTLRRLLPVIAFLLCGSLWAQLSLPATSPYTQDFNTTPGAAGTTYPSGWIAYDGTTPDNAMNVSTGSTTTGGNHNYGSRIGVLASGSYTAPLYINLGIFNTTGKTGLKISYKVIKMREQGRNNSFNLEVSTTSATSGFTAVTGGSYDSGSLAEGNIATYTNLDLSALDNKTTGVYIRWAYEDIGGSGSRDGIALDDVSISWDMAPVIPNAPVATAATNMSSTGFMANWNGVTNATGYRLDVAIDNAFASILEDYDNIAVTGTSKMVNLGLQPNTTYYYRVRAEQGAETSASSNIISITTLLPPLAAPVATAATGVLSNGFTANWDAVAGATGYYLDVSTSPDFGTTTPGSFITETFENMPVGITTPSTTTWTGDGGITWTATKNRTDRVIGLTTDRLLCLFKGSAADDASLESGVITGGLTNITFDAWKVLNNGSYSTMTVYVLSGAGFATQTNLGSIDTATNTTTKNIFNSGPVTGIIGDYKIRIEVTANYESTPPGNLARTGINNLKFGADQIVTPIFVTGYDGLDVGNVTTYQVTGLNPNTIYYYRVRAYTASQTSINSNTITAQTVCETLAVPVVAVTAFCGTATVADLTATGTGLKWYSADAPTVELAAADALSSGNYLVTQTVGGCTSAATPFTVTINAIPAAPAVTPMAICGSGTIADLDATGDNLKWYADNTTTTELTSTEALVAGSYFVSQTVNGCESSRAEVVVTINTIPAAPAVAPLSICGSGTVAELIGTGDNLKWYADNTTTTELTGAEALAAGSYFVSQTVNGCESPRAELAVTINALPDAPQTAPLNFCGTTPATQLTATGVNLKWYADSTTTTELAPTATLSTQSYYVSQTVNGCESQRAEVAVVVTAIPAAPSVSNPAQTFCSGATVAELLPNTAEHKWYTSSSATTALDADEVLTDGLSIYYVSQIVNGCESTGRTPVAVMVNVTAMPAATAQTFCDGATTAELDATGTSLKWYADATTTTQLTSGTELATGSYYVTQTLNNCESTRLEVQVTVNAPTVTGAATQVYNEGDTLADLDVTGTGILWYADEQLTQVLPDATPLINNTIYYAVSVIGVCESEALPVTVQEVAATQGFDLSKLKYYPNPLADLLNISYSEAITSVTVYNLLGQPVLQAKPNAVDAQADLSALAAGQYIVKLVAGNKTQTVKVVKH